MDFIREWLEIHKSDSAEVTIFCLTILTGFISWLVKGLIESPLANSKDSFNRYVERRIEILAEVKTRLLYLMYFPRDDSTEKIKEELQKIILRDGKVGYLDRETLANIINISKESATKEKLVLKTYHKIEEELERHIWQVAKELNFYSNFSDVSPVRRMAMLLLLGILNFLALAICVALIIILIFWFVVGTFWIKIGLILCSVMVIYLLQRASKVNYW